MHPVTVIYMIMIIQHVKNACVNVIDSAFVFDNSHACDLYQSSLSALPLAKTCSCARGNRNVP